MKKLLTLSLMYLLVGCESPESGDSNAMREVEVGLYLSIYKDTRTGCHYIRSASGGLTPRLYSDGVQVCD